MALLSSTSAHERRLGRMNVIRAPTMGWDPAVHSETVLHPVFPSPRPENYNKKSQGAFTWEAHRGGGSNSLIILSINAR